MPKSAKLIIDQSSSGEFEFITIQMKNVQVGANAVGSNQRGELTIPNLKVKGIQVHDPEIQSIHALLEEASQEDSKNVNRGAQLLTLRIHEMKNQVLGRINQRFAMSVIPLLIVLLGSLMAIRYSDRPPLTVYARVFIPSIIAILLVFAGGQMVRDNRIAQGFSVMWLGNFFLALSDDASLV